MMSSVFFFNDTATTEIYTLSLHDALPILDAVQNAGNGHPGTAMALAPLAYTIYTRFLRHNPENPHWTDRDRFVLSAGHASDRKSTRLNSSHANISYAVFCLKKKKRTASRT